ncbi:HalOD1 output domain-containing protein [Natrinema gelatinilyticum]|uniref:HalOD1 output domain-containing protein n=1 Tax=Natrinema gelatinilyticum TaxID=2961571 RepID=UPI0020C54F5E|nr:HalOD1 output domain-containing protein [Natrinema gelatinilyticum]
MTSTTLDYHHDSISLRVIDAIANATNTEPHELDPLYYVVDPEALDQLFQSDSNAPIRVEFEYDGLLVEIRSDGTVAIDGTIHGRA